MNKFNSILENIKIMVSSVYGKLIIIVFIITTLATFFLATVQNYDIAFSFFRGIMSAIISCLVILGTYFLITKIIGKEIIENNKKSIPTETDEFDLSHENTLKNNDNDNDNDNDSTNPTFNKDDENIDKFDVNNLDIDDLDNDKTSIMDRLNSVDKNPKVSYHNDIESSDDVESVLSENKIKQSPIDTSLSDDSFIDFSAPPPSTGDTGDTETMAKAVRTMRSKDKEQEN